MQVASTPFGQLTAEQRRVRRLFAVLEDLARYAPDNAGTSPLAHVWDRISELLLRADETAVVAAAGEVARHRVGSSAWWRAVHRVAGLLDLSDRRSLTAS